MVIKSYSKINIFLLVYKRKKNNLHKIKSLIALNKDIYDDIEINISNKLEINYYKNNKKIIIDDCNVKKVLLAIKNKYKIEINFLINIYKNIPFFSGLGGSSSNAAFIAKYVLDLNKINYKNDFDFFVFLGSDIPFFLSGHNFAYVSNFGDKIKEKKINKLNYRIIFNSKKISSKELYLYFDKNRKFNFLRNYYIQLFFLKVKMFNYLINDIQKSKIIIY